MEWKNSTYSQKGHESQPKCDLKTRKDPKQNSPVQESILYREEEEKLEWEKKHSKKRRNTGIKSFSDQYTDQKDKHQCTDQISPNRAETTPPNRTYKEHSKQDSPKEDKGNRKTNRTTAERREMEGENLRVEQKEPTMKITQK